MNQGSGSIRQTSILYTLHVYRHIHLDIINNNKCDRLCENQSYG